MRRERVNYDTQWAMENVWAKGIVTWDWWLAEEPLRWWCVACDGEDNYIKRETAPTAELEEVLDHIKTEEHQANLLLRKLGGELSIWL